MHAQVCNVLLGAPSRLRADGHAPVKGETFMASAKRDSILKAGVASLAFAAVALAFAPMAGAQAMGEYGAVVGNSASMAASAPHADLPALPGTSAQTNSSGTSTTEIREDDSSPEDAKAADTDNSQSGDEWSEVKGGSDDGN
jgi:hypothetical protein